MIVLILQEVGVLFLICSFICIFITRQLVRGQYYLGHLGFTGAGGGRGQPAGCGYEIDS